MSRVHWTQEARSRLRAIERYIERDSPKAAKAVVTRILGQSRQLETAPLSGRRVPELGRREVRELLERPYRIIYRVVDDRVDVLTVMHYRQLLPEDLLPP
jgi:addiction module RelE/StbE family toxin